LHPGDGLLYIGTGDNNLPENTPRFFDDPKCAPQNLAALRGKILRIRTHGTVPSDNPFVGRVGARAEVFA
jgi:glucose/arabinose dehydrogenase